MQLCQTHEERGFEVEGIHQVGSGWLCDDCFHGKAVFPEEEQVKNYAFLLLEPIESQNQK